MQVFLAPQAVVVPTISLPIELLLAALLSLLAVGALRRRAH